VRIKITGCSNPRAWYSDKIGDEFSVVEKLSGVYIVIVPENPDGIVFEQDAESVGYTRSLEQSYQRGYYGERFVHMNKFFTKRNNRSRR
jgi:hypothetical protein